MKRLNKRIRQLLRGEKHKVQNIHVKCWDKAVQRCDKMCKLMYS